MWAVLPIKDLDAAKQRLTDVLSPAERRGLFRAMVEDVLAALAAVDALDGVMIVSGDPEAAALADRYGARLLHEPENQGHTAAVTTAASVLVAEGADGMVQVPGDVPLITAEEVAGVLAMHGAGRAMTIVPAHDERGSNCVVLSPPDVMPLRFGNDSFFPHLASARERGLEPRIVEMPGLALDIDTPADLTLLLQRPAPTRTHVFLDESGIAARLGASSAGQAAILTATQQA